MEGFSKGGKVTEMFGSHSKEKNVILFTGQPGIKAIECLGRLKKHVEDDAEIISVDKKMSVVSGKSFKTEILLKTISYQYELWGTAFNGILDGLNHSKFAKTTFLTFHGVYYNQNKREFVSPIDLEKIGELRGKVKAVVVFIDDIYDVYRRLMVDGEMYSYVKELKPLEALYASIFNLISILEWRDVEITVSRLIARALNIPIYVVATKHPAFMVARLINVVIKDLEIFYLAHPISAIREEAIDQLPNFTGELNLFAKELIKSPRMVLFLPGMIDELVIKMEDGKYLAECLPRWSLPYDKQDLITPPLLPKELEDLNPLNPLEYDCGSSSEISTAVSYLLKLLWDRIKEQLTSRDFTLVEQSKNGVRAYRPYFPHKLAGGVMRELEHNRELRKKEPLRRSIVLSVVEDQGKARIDHLFVSIEALVKDLDEPTKRLLRSKSYEWICEKEWVEIFSDDRQLMDKFSDVRNEVEKLLPESYKFNSKLYETSLRPGEMGTEEIERRIEFQDILNSLLTDQLKDYIILESDYQKDTEIRIETVPGKDVGRKQKEVKL